MAAGHAQWRAAAVRVGERRGGGCPNRGRGGEAAITVVKQREQRLCGVEGITE
jgi:hypothetical protein